MRAFLCLFIAAAMSTVYGFLLDSRQSPYPTCANPCLANANMGTCGAGEITCLCKDNAFVVNVTQCFEASCSGSDLTNAEQVAQDTCKAAGVTLTSSIPPATKTPAASASASAAPSSSKTNSTSTTSSSSSPSATTSSKSSAVSHAVNIIVGAAALGLTALLL